MSSTKVAFLGYPLWSVGSINYQIGKHLHDCDVYHLDWNNLSDVQRARSGWFDVIIGDAYILKVLKNSEAEHKKVIPMFHQNVMELKGSTSFDVDLSEFVAGKTLYAVSEKVAQSVMDRYGCKCDVLGVGVNRDFFPIQEYREIKTIGHVANLNKGEDYEKVKGFDLFDEICDKANVSGKRVQGKSFMCGSYIYNDVDVVVCTSKSESLPIVMFECAAMKIPFISTKVGVVTNFSSVKTFETSEEASDLINQLKDKDFRNQYVEDVYEEVMKDRDWETIVHRDYDPLINPNRKLSVIIPTMWKSPRTKRLIDSVSSSDVVSEILIVDNDPSKRPSEIKGDKIKYIHEGENIYVNPSWNLGVSESKEDYICLMNDDIEFDCKEYLKKMIHYIDDGCCTGMDKGCYTKTETTLKVKSGHCIGDGWGCCIMFKKEDYVEIPDEIKIWYGDNWIVENSKKVMSFELPVKSEMCTTSGLSSFYEVCNRDSELWKKYTSNEFEMS